MKFKKILSIIESRPVLVIALATLLITSAFVLMQNVIIGGASLDISRELGQEKEAGYFFGDYTVQVNHLIEHGSLVSDGKVQNRYPPLFPYIIYGGYLISSFTGLGLQGVIIFLTALINFLTALLLYRIATLFKIPAWQGILAALLFLSHPYILWGYTKVMSVMPYLTVLFASLWLLLKVQQKDSRKFELSYLWIGGLLGLGMLIRPIGLFVPFVFMILMVIRDGFRPWNLAHMAMLLLAALLVITPWQYANHSRGQEILLSSDRTISIRDSFLFLRYHESSEAKMNPKMEELVLRMGSAPYETKSEFLEVFFEEFRENPGTMVRLYLLKAARSWYGSIDRHPAEEKAKMIISLFYILLSIPGTLAVLRMPDKKNLMRAYVLLILYFWFMTLLVVSMVRYLIPIFAFMTIFIPVGIPSVTAYLKKTQARFSNGR